MSIQQKLENLTSIIYVIPRILKNTGKGSKNKHDKFSKPCIYKK